MDVLLTCIGKHPDDRLVYSGVLVVHANFGADVTSGAIDSVVSGRVVDVLYPFSIVVDEHGVVGVMFCVMFVELRHCHVVALEKFFRAHEVGRDMRWEGVT